MEQEWISLNEFMRRNKMGHTAAKKMIYEGKVECQKIGTHYKIKTFQNDKDYVPRKLYEEILQRALKAETKLESIQAVLK